MNEFFDGEGYAVDTDLLEEGDRVFDEQGQEYELTYEGDVEKGVKDKFAGYFARGKKDPGKELQNLKDGSPLLQHLKRHKKMGHLMPN